MFGTIKEPSLATTNNDQFNNHTKDISFLRWLNPFSHTNNNNTSSYRSTLPSRGSTPNLGVTVNNENNNLTPTGSTDIEYRGVEGLKQFWNNHISSFKDTKHKSATLGYGNNARNDNHKYAGTTNLTASRSIGCLVNRSQSYENSCLISEKPSTVNCNNNNQLTRRSSDNFYKYKTAEIKGPAEPQIIPNNTSPVKSQLTEIGTKSGRRNFIERNKQLTCSNGINFPLIASTAKGEKICWAKREDIFVKRKQKSQLLSSDDSPPPSPSPVKLNSIRIDKQQTFDKKLKQNTSNLGKKCNKDFHKTNNIVKNSLTDDDVDNTILRTSTIHTNVKCDNNDKTITAMAIKRSDKISATNIDNRTTNTTQAMAEPILKKFNEKTDSSDSTVAILADGRSHNSSANSLNILTCSSSDSPNRSKKSSNTAGRKYSFRTHGKNLYSPRKAAHHHHHHHQVMGSKVAALTLQFNQMLEKDSAILKEVKKNNGVIMARAGHVYKIKEDNDSVQRKKLAKRNASMESEEGSIKLGKKKSLARKIKGDGTVRATIRKFEGSPAKEALEINGTEIEQDLVKPKISEKPIVPQKSEHVLKRTKDLQTRNVQKKPKPAPIELSTNPLEEIKEENKTPGIGTARNLGEPQVSDVKVKDAVDSETSPPETDPTEESKKSRYTRIYEKFRFRTQFFPNKKLQENRVPHIEEPPIEPDHKIKDAISTVNKKLEHLSKSASDIRILQSDKEEIGQIKPNPSFLFRTNSKTYIPTTPTTPILFEAETHDVESATNLVEAINTRMISKTQSMDDTIFPSLPSETSTELYEPIVAHTIETSPITAPQKSFLFTRLLSKTSEFGDIKTVQNQHTGNYDDASNIYQTVSEAHNGTKLLDESLRKLIIDGFGDDDSCETYESLSEAQNDLHFAGGSNETEDGYVICDAPPVPPPLPSAPSTTTTTTTTPTTVRIPELQRNTRDELPAIPEPKRVIPNSYLVATRKAPPRPNKSPLLDRTKLPEIPNSLVQPMMMLSAQNHSLKKLQNTHDHHDYDDEENIYDTIRGSELIPNGYDFLPNKCSSKSLDTVSISSNCYETINSVRRISIVHNSDSVSTSSSDHRTNSLYGMPVNGRSSNPTNDGSSDNNSDDWVDMSDADDEATKNSKQQFVVVRERTKCHRSPDWSKRVRDQRIQKQSQNYFDDDSDHYYEPLFPAGIIQNAKVTTPPNKIDQPNKMSPLLIMPSADNNISSINDKSTIAENQHNQNHYHHHHLHQHKNHHNHHHPHHSDEYDSFDTDDETDEDVKKNDSGVDISNVKLPDPPQPTNQVYAFVKKVKNFISNKKVSTSPKTPTIPTTDKQYENTQFYIAPNEYQNTKFPDKKSPKKKTPKLTKKSIMKRDSSGSYENTEFHAPIIIIPKSQVIEEITTTTTTTASSPVQTVITTPLAPISPQQLPSDPSEDIKSTKQQQPDLTNRRKSKSEKSFKSKLRKSLTGSSHSYNSSDIANTLNSPRSTFYISDSIDLDSGIFEKTVSTTPQPPVEPTLPEESTKLDETIEPPPIPPVPVTRKSKRNLRSPDLNRRRSTIGIRPNNPPPPPPTDKKSASLLNQKQRTTTSWYAECGVFKANGITDDNKESRGERNSNASWYADAGLYQTSGASVASSSGSSGVSTGGEGGPGDDNNSHSMFFNEPLYQIYSAAKLESISRDMEDQDSADGYEEIGNLTKRVSRPSALQLVGPKQGPSRTLWSEIPEVINSEILSTLTPTERRLQEAKFEILTSEASYLKSLNLLRSHFMNHPAFRDTAILSASDRKILFSHIVPVHDCSDRLLSDLESCWQDNIMLLGLSKSIYKNAEKYFHVYIAFCEHQGKMDRTLRKLKEQKNVFSQVLETLESDTACCGLNLHSFLMLPMQRITRLPLLIDAVFSKVKADDDEYDSWKMTLSILNKIVSQCNDAANRYEQAFEIQRISRQIEFPSNIRSLAIAPVGVAATGAKPRTLVKKGDLVHLIWRGDDAKLTFGKKFTKCNVFAFLFTDLLILSKKKSDEQFIVFDYCPRSMLTISSGDSIPQLPTKDINQAGKNLILMTLLENHEGKTIEMIFSCPSVSDQQRWLEATTTPESETPGEKLYEAWDCPQVIAKHEYAATEPDLLSLEPGDVVNVTRKLPDGWYQGERIRDGVNGWFPGNYTEEVNSAHVRARNLKQRYRLLTFTATYLEMQKRK